MKAATIVIAGVLLTAHTALSQVEATQAQPIPSVEAKHAESELTEIKSPMQLDIPLGVSTQPNGKPRVSIHDFPINAARTYTETGRYVCDKAQVRMVVVKKLEDDKRGAKLSVSPALSTGWFRQDIDLTVAIVSDGAVVAKQFWHKLTIGEDSAASKLGVWGSSQSKSPEAVFNFPAAHWAAMFEGGKAPMVRVVVEIVP